MKRILFIIFLLLFASFAEAKSLYVNNSGSPACSDATTYANNTAANPWCTLLRAVRGNSDGNRSTAGVTAQAAQAGDTVYVTAGTYNYGGSWAGGGWLDVFYNPINSGTSEAWITFEAVGTVTLTGNTSGRAPVIGSNTGSYVKWVGFTINQANIGWRNALTAVTVNNVWLERNTLIGAYTDYGVDDNHAGIMVHGPRASDCTGGINNITIRNNTLYGWRGASGRNDSSITLYCLGNNILIEHNEIYSNTTGIYAKSNYVDNQNINVRYNYFRNNTGDAIAMQAFSDWKVYQNIMRDNGSGFVFFCTIYYVGNAKPNDVYVVNNTMDGNRVGIYFKSLCSNLNNNYVRNNIITNSTHSILTDSAECTTTGNMGVDDVNFNYNVYQHSSYFYGDDGGGQVTTFSNWKSSYGQDGYSVNNVDPLYVNASEHNFKLQAGSPCREGNANDGVDVLDLDNDGQTNDPITIGAYITGSENIGRTIIGLSPPRNLTTLGTE